MTDFSPSVKSVKRVIGFDPSINDAEPYKEGAGSTALYVTDLWIDGMSGKRDRQMNNACDSQARHSSNDFPEPPKRARVDGSLSPAVNGGKRDEANDGEETATIVDPIKCFPNILRCDMSIEDSLTRVFYWHSPDGHIPMSAEEAMIPLLMRDKKKEFGMARKLPHWRMKKIRKGCRELRVPLPCALSLRRHHMQRVNRGRPLESLGLGREHQVRKSAEIFELCVQDLLDRSGVPYWSEGQQRKHNAKTHRTPKGKRAPPPPTPDFLLKKPLQVRRYHVSREDRSSCVSEEARVCWIDAKMFYGASSIPPDGRSAVGSLLAKAEKYVAIFGPGAIVFMFGCGDQLAAQLAGIGVLALDCWSNEMVSLERVREHQRSWCGNDNGEILP
jgi:Protein of unknown function TPD sequence-motif